MKTVKLSSGTLEYIDQGEGPTVVFVHGLLVDHRVWMPVIEHLSKTHRCIAPNWPLGSHSIPMHPDADLSAEGVAALVAEFLEVVGLNEVTLVGNDSGGAVCQVVAARHADRLERLVLSNCDALEVFPPKEFEYLTLLGKIPALYFIVAKAMRAVPALRRMKTAYGGVTARPIPDALLHSWVEPSASDSGVRRDAGKFVRSAHRDLTMAVAKELSSFDKPALLVWGKDDPYFTTDLASRLASCFPNARVKEISDGKTFVCLDQPQQVAQAIRTHGTRAAAA